MGYHNQEIPQEITTTMNQQNRVQELADEIYKHRNAYYNGEALISDDEYEVLCDKLRLLDPEHKALTDVGAEPVSEWPKVKHTAASGSLNKAKTPAELRKWITDNALEKEALFWSDKLDGLTVMLTYEKGELKTAATRGGNKGIGEDITPNVIKMAGVKKFLSEPFTGTIRGEIMLRKSKFKQYFSDGNYANERNAASGISRRYDGAGCEHLKVFCYQVTGNEKLFTEFAQFQFLKALGLHTPNYGAYNSRDALNEIIAVWDKYQCGERAALDYCIDGIVVRANSLELQEKLGAKHQRPVGAIAFKFEAEEAVSTIQAITLQVGSQGHITPVAEIEPTELVGAQIKRATLHNFARIEELGADVGAQVIISRRGDIIPQIEEVIESTGTVFQAPTKCPDCGENVEQRGEFLICPNTATCPAQVIGRLRNWINGLSIDEWGDKLLEQLYNEGLVDDIFDLYSLEVETLADLDRMGTKSATKCLNNLWAVSSIPLDVFIGSLSIPLCNKSTVRLVMNAGFNTIDKLLVATEQDFLKVKGIGGEKARHLYNGLQHNKDLIDQLFKINIWIKEETMASGKLKDMRICITGKTNRKREDWAVLIEENGGQFKKSVSKDTTHLLIADPNSQSIKAVSAKKAGIKLLSEADLDAMLI